MIQGFVRQPRNIVLELGADKTIRVTEWEKSAIIRIAQGWQVSEIAKADGLKRSAAQNRLTRACERFVKEFRFPERLGTYSTITQTMCAIAYSAGLVRLL